MRPQLRTPAHRVRSVVDWRCFATSGPTLLCPGHRGCVARWTRIRSRMLRGILIKQKANSGTKTANSSRPRGCARRRSVCRRPTPAGRTGRLARAGERSRASSVGPGPPPVAPHDCAGALHDGLAVVRVPELTVTVVTTGASDDALAQFPTEQIGLATRQPTIWRANTSTTKATYAKPLHVATYVTSDTHNRFGRVATKARSTRSAGPTWADGSVVIRVRPRTAPARPIAPINRRTVHRATPWPSRRNCRQTFRGPYTW